MAQRLMHETLAMPCRAALCPAHAVHTYVEAAMCIMLCLWHTSCLVYLTCHIKKSVGKYIGGVRRDMHEIDEIKKGKDYESWSSSH
jgi:hypothetical protein